MNARSWLPGFLLAIAAWPDAAMCFSWEFSDVVTSNLDYGDVDVITQGDAAAFSVFAVAKLDSVSVGDQTVVGQIDGASYGWVLALDDVIGSDADRWKFWNRDSVTGHANEVYADDGNEAEVDQWYALGASYTADVGGAGAVNDLYIDGTKHTKTREFTQDAGVHLSINKLRIGGRENGRELDGLIGVVAVWDGVHLSAGQHRALAQGADPRTIQPDSLTFFARLEEPDAIDYVSLITPTPGAGTNFNTDRWPEFKPIVQSLGDVTPTSIRIMSHVGRPAVHKIEYSRDTSYGGESEALLSSRDLDYVVVHRLTGLTPNTSYNYRVVVDGAVIQGSESTFTTAPAAEGSSFRFVYSSCTEFDLNEPPYDRYSQNAFNGIDARDPDFVVHTGDVWYSDGGGSDSETPFNAYELNTVEAFNRKVMQILSERDFALFQKKYPIYMAPDDHEWTNNVDGDNRKDSAYGKALAGILNWQFQKNPPRHPNAVDRDGLWYTFSYGDVDFFMLDMRTQRGINGGSGTALGNTLGETDGQLGDLLAWIDVSTAKFKVILAQSPLSDHGTSRGGDSWKSAFPADQHNVIDVLRERSDIVWFAGDVHWSGHVRVARSADLDPAHAFYEFIGGTFGGHLSPPSTEKDTEHLLLKAYDGRGVDGLDPGRYSYLVVDVDTSRITPTMDVQIVSHNFASGEETVEWDTRDHGLTIKSTWRPSVTTGK